MDLRVKDILDRPHFECAQILVGMKGLNRTIKWVHVVEIDTFGHLLNGQEMVLTTGIGWMNDDAKRIHYLQQLLDHDASVLCIELNGKVKSVPEDMLALAEKHDFPIIIFNKEVKFVEITKDIHKLLLGYQEKIWWDLEHLYKEMYQNLVNNGSIDSFLKILHQGTNKQVSLIHNSGQSWVFPPPKDKQKLIDDMTYDNRYFSVPIYYLNEVIANLYILEDETTTFEQFAINRCSEVLAQYFWKHHQQIELEKVKKEEWISKAIYGEIPRNEIMNRLRQRLGSNLNIKEMIIGVFPANEKLLPKKVNNNLLSGTLMSIRRVFENEGFNLLTSVDKKRDCYILLLINQHENIRLFEGVKSVISTIQTIEPDFSPSENLLSFGKVITHIDHILSSYETALSTLDYQRNIEALTNPFYQNLGTYRLFEYMKDMAELRDIVDDYIGPLISYDQEKGSELVKTLKVYLKNLGAKNQTADDLFIVRQTLYHRLERIEKLIGKDYMEPKKRIMIELAIHALDYLEKSKFE